MLSVGNNDSTQPEYRNNAVAEKNYTAMNFNESQFEEKLEGILSKNIRIPISSSDFIQLKKKKGDEKCYYNEIRSLKSRET